MILSDNSIRKLIEENELSTNVTELNIQPASLDITVGNTFSFPDETVSDGIIRMDVPLKYKVVEQDTYLLMPGQFVLATTEQYFKIPNDLTAFVEGRSSIGRLGLFIQNAGWVDPGFEGQITLELFNASRYAIEIKAGIRVGQLVFSPTDSPVANAYRGKYQGQTGATGSMIYKDYVKYMDNGQSCVDCIRNNNDFCELNRPPIITYNDYCRYFVRKAEMCEDDYISDVCGDCRSCANNNKGFCNILTVPIVTKLGSGLCKYYKRDINYLVKNELETDDNNMDE